MDITLDNIENGILHAVYNDGIHYALNCGSIGCPNLSATAFTAENIEQLLEYLARLYERFPRGQFHRGRLHCDF